MLRRKLLIVALAATSCLISACTLGRADLATVQTEKLLSGIRTEMELDVCRIEEEQKAEEERLAAVKALEEEKKAKEEAKQKAEEAKKAEEARKAEEEKKQKEAEEAKKAAEAERKKISLEEEEKKKAEEKAKAEAEEKARAEEEALAAEEARKAEEQKKAESEAVAVPAGSAIDIANQTRRENGLTDLSPDATLNALATTRAVEAAQVFSHTRPDGRSCFSILDDNAVVYMTCGENIAAGQQTEQEVMNAWLNSPGHRANILNGAFHKVGLGYFDAGDAYGRYWVTIFTD